MERKWVMIMPVKGAIFIVICVAIIAVFQRDELWEWLNSWHDDEEPNEKEE